MVLFEFFLSSLDFPCCTIWSMFQCHELSNQSFCQSFLFLPLIFFILMITSFFFEILWFFFLFFLCLSDALKLPYFLYWTKRLWTIWTFINEVWKYFLESWHVPYISFFISLVCSQMFFHFWVQTKYNEQHDYFRKGLHVQFPPKTLFHMNEFWNNCFCNLL
jgi:hypothetical protein